jgi:hypothetical protein
LRFGFPARRLNCQIKPAQRLTAFKPEILAHLNLNRIAVR